jgi:hypothetical protein
MKSKDLIQRFKHAFKRPAEAGRRILMRTFLSLFGVDFSKQTEIQYVELGFFDSKILRKEIISKAENLAFSSNDLTFEHCFSSKYQIEISDVVVNTRLNHIYVTGSNERKFSFLKESTSWSAENLIIFSPGPTRNISQVIEYAKLGLPNSGHYHWVSEDLPNYLMDNSKYETLAYSRGNEKSKVILNKLGMHCIDSNEWVFVKNLSFVTKSNELGYLHPKSHKALIDLQNYIGLNALKGSKNFYISRSRTRRSALWERDLEKHLLEKGFEIVYAEEHSILRQIELFRDAKNIVGVHGAGLTNAIWSSNCSIIELMPTNRINRCVEWQTNIANGKYERIYFDPKVTRLSNITKEIDALIRQ